MSMKIYTGFKVPSEYSKDFDSLNKWMKIISDEAHTFMGTEYNKQFARLFCHNILDLYGWQKGFYKEMPTDLLKTLKYYHGNSKSDEYILQNYNKENISYFHIKCGIERLMSEYQMEIEKTHQQNPAYNFIPSIPLTILDNNVYGIVDDEHEFYEYLLKIGLIDDFYYQNQTDQDENISDEEWEKRYEVWDKIDEFTFEILIDYTKIQNSFIFYNDKIKSFMDYIEEKHNSYKEIYIKELIINDICKELENENPDEAKQARENCHFSYFFEQLDLVRDAYNNIGDESLIKRVSDKKNEYNSIFDDLDIKDYILKLRDKS